MSKYRYIYRRKFGFGRFILRIYFENRLIAIVSRGFFCGTQLRFARPGAWIYKFGHKLPWDGFENVLRRAKHAIEFEAPANELFPQTFGIAEIANHLAAKFVDEILNHPDVVLYQTNRYWGFDLYIPIGRGIRFDGKGNFRGFLQNRRCLGVRRIIQKDGLVARERGYGYAICSSDEHKNLQAEVNFNGDFAFLISQEEDGVFEIQIPKETDIKKKNYFKIPWIGFIEILNEAISEI